MHFHGIVPGTKAKSLGQITLDVVFSGEKNFQKEKLTFEVVDFCSAYHAILGRPAYALFMAKPCYVYLKLKMPGPRGVIIVNGNTEHSLRIEEHTAALAAEAQSSLSRQSTSSAFQDPDTFKCARSNRQLDRLARSELA